jgi:hypothetical protein
VAGRPRWRDRVVHFVVIGKRSRQLKIKKFQSFAKEIRIGADREVSKDSSGKDSHCHEPF